MMKKYAYALAGLLLAGCSGDFVKLGAGEAWGEFAGTFTLQGKIMDARTGAPLGGDDLKIKLIQGTEIRDPNRLIKDANDPLVGEYAFSNIPLTTQDQAYYKLVVMKDGYIQFESVLDYFYAYYDTNFPLMDTVYNYIGDVYMHPVGASAPDITVNVTFNGKPVPNATVMLDPSSNTYGNGTDSSGYTLSAYWGYAQAQSATTSATGQAVFPGSGLGLGVIYTIRVTPTTFEGITLQDPRSGAWPNYYPTVAVGVVGNSTQQSVSMVAATPGGNPYGLYVVDASNKWGDLDPVGKLVLTFSRPIALTGSLTNKFWVDSYNGGVLASTFASSSLSADGRTLTLTPNWATQPSPSADRGAYVSYADANITIVDYPGTSYNIFSLSLSTGATVNRNVQITTPN